LTGFNHYADCGCGWCVNTGGRSSGAERTRLVDDMRERDALHLLKTSLARSISGCYVIPNAKCPVCGDAVYFYANEHGSRVFFDHLGPPWPKHPCTDNPREPAAASQGGPTRRTRGMMQELITAANTAGLFRNKVFGRRIPDEWTMLLVVFVERDGIENTVTAEFLDSQSGETTQFKCRSAEPILEPGDFVNMKGLEISFLDKQTLTPITFLAGSLIVIPEKTSRPPLPPRPPAPPQSRLTPTPRKPTLPKPTAQKPTVLTSTLPEKNRAGYSRAPMTEAEMVHFNSDAVGLGELFAKLEPVVKAYAREQTRKPADVSLRLNAEGHTTAAGAPWTPRLVHFLLALMFNDPKNDKKPNDKKPDVRTTRPAGSATAKTAPTGAARISMDDKDGLARLLSSLGRVTVKH
jgi:hypothetical protein